MNYIGECKVKKKSDIYKKSEDFLLCECYAGVGDGDEAAFVEVSDSLFVDAFGDAKLGFDIFGAALVAEVATAALRLEIAQEGIREVGYHATGIFRLAPFLDL